MEFLIGCNYWATHAGPDMWRNWDEEAVISDLDLLAENGVRVVRAFPTWRDFQPIIPIYAGSCNLRHYILEGEREPENIYWIDPIMIERFSRFCDLCYERNIKIIVGIITGWMSGRLFIPPALYGKNLLTDTTALLFEQRFVRGIVTLLRNKKAIYAWDLGNECYALHCVESEYDTANWTATITANIRSCDSTRPIISSGDNAVQHSDEGCKWTIDAEAEFCDILARHPYPYWSKFGYKDYTASYRTMIHATAQVKYFSDLSGKPCITEEIGTMGPMVCSNEIAADFARANVFSVWANGSNGFLWWCANDQTNLVTYPYIDNMCELELGLLDINHKPKPVLTELKKLNEIISGFNFDLPKAKEDAVLIVSGTKECWKKAFLTYGIAKQAGLNVRFTTGEKELPESDLYILPSISGHYIMKRNIYLELKKRVKEGATLYISNESGILSEFSEITGMKVVDSCNTQERGTVATENYSISFKRARRYNISSEKATVLAYDSIGIPAVTVHNYGLGKVYYVNFPLESGIADEDNAFDNQYYKLYRDIFSEKLSSLEIFAENQYVGLTRHIYKGGKIICVAINYSQEPQRPRFLLKKGIKIEDIYYGNTEVLNPFDACIFTISSD
jgi:endo-1,4-beta-mannosidase